MRASFPLSHHSCGSCWVSGWGGRGDAEVLNRGLSWNCLPIIPVTSCQLPLIPGAPAGFPLRTVVTWGFCFSPPGSTLGAEMPRETMPVRLSYRCGGTGERIRTYTCAFCFPGPRRQSALTGTCEAPRAAGGGAVEPGPGHRARPPLLSLLSCSSARWFSLPTVLASCLIRTVFKVPQDPQ